MDTEYTPISCAAHDELLALATKRQRCELVVRGADGGTARLEGVIQDVYTSEGAEYLRLNDGSVVRLDRLVSVDGRSVPAA